MKKARDFTFTSEGTPLKDLVIKPEGTIGVFKVRARERNELQRLAHGYAKIFEGKVEIISFPIVWDGQEDVWHIVCVSILKQGRPKKKRGRKKLK